MRHRTLRAVAMVGLCLTVASALCFLGAGACAAIFLFGDQPPPSLPALAAILALVAFALGIVGRSWQRDADGARRFSRHG